MGRIQAMIDHAVAIANDDSHGYSWADRWNVDRDCSSLMYDSADAAGYDVGRGGDKYTGTMIDDFSNAGFTVHDYDSFEEYPGCILLRDPAGPGGHTEMYIGDGLTVGAHIAETGDVYGEPGDQTGDEISIAPNPGNWDYILEPPMEGDDMALSDNDVQRIAMAILGYMGPDVKMDLRPNGEKPVGVDVYQMIWDAARQLTRDDRAGHDTPEKHDMYGRINMLQEDSAEMKQLLKQILAKL